jgi:hypothetical protein
MWPARRSGDRVWAARVVNFHGMTASRKAAHAKPCSVILSASAFDSLRNARKIPEIFRCEGATWTREGNIMVRLICHKLGGSAGGDRTG